MIQNNIKTRNGINFSRWGLKNILTNPVYAIADMDIYNYFVSISKGEQVPFRMMSNIEYEEIEKRAKEKGIPFEEQFNQENGILIEDYAELQKHGMRK